MVKCVELKDESLDKSYSYDAKVHKILKNKHKQLVDNAINCIKTIRLLSQSNSHRYRTY